MGIQALGADRLQADAVEVGNVLVGVGAASKQRYAVAGCLAAHIEFNFNLGM